ncbi:MAG: PHB depolymerase family esterase [Burkholderiales bacterium]
MARRIRKTLWSRSFQRTLGALTRATLRRGTRAVVKASTKALKAAVKPPARPRKAAAATRSAAGNWLSGAAIGPAGARRYQLFKPPGARRSSPLPVLVMLHGCDQDVAGFARSTRMQALAAREGFMLLFPEQDRLANPQGCWNWFETRSGRAFTEAASLIAVVDQACALHGADPARVAVAGFSAGAGMAGFLALHYPARFRAVAMHSGIAPGTAHSTGTAISAMQGRRTPHPLAPSTVLPPLLVIQGSADAIVRAGNGRAAAQLWGDAAGARPSAARSVQRGARRAMTLIDFKLRGRIVATLCEVVGLGHAWSGGAASQRYGDATGPDASRLIWAFAARQFAVVAQSAAKQ